MLFYSINTKLKANGQIDLGSATRREAEDIFALLDQLKAATAGKRNLRRPDKKKRDDSGTLPMFCPAHFYDDRLREPMIATPLSCFVVDVDGKNGPATKVGEAHDEMRRDGITHAIYTTLSHQPLLGMDCYRVMIATDRPVLVAELPMLLKVFKAAYSPLDGKCKNSNRGYFVPYGDFLEYRHQGVPICVDEWLEAAKEIPDEEDEKHKKLIHPPVRADWKEGLREPAEEGFGAEYVDAVIEREIDRIHSVPRGQGKRNDEFLRSAYRVGSVCAAASYPVLTWEVTTRLADAMIETGYEVARSRSLANRAFQAGYRNPRMPKPKEPTRSVEPPKMVGTQRGEFPLEVLPERIRKAIEAIAWTSQVDVRMAAQGVLAGAAMATQHLRNVCSPDFGAIPIGNYYLCIAGSGERKSAVFKAIRMPFDRVQRDREADFEEARQRHEAAHAIYVADRKKIINSGKAPQEKARALGELPKSEEPINPYFIFGDTTMEALTETLGQGQPAACWMLEEGAKFYGGHSAQAENKVRSAGTLCDFWGGSVIDPKRVTRETTKLYNRRLSAYWVTQPEVVGDWLHDRIMEGQGLTARFLIVQAPSMSGHRDPRRARREPEKMARHGADIRAYQERLEKLLRTPAALKEGSANELDPPVLILTEEAEEVYYDFQEWIEPQKRDGERFASIRGFAEKAAEHGLRIAASLTVFEVVNANRIGEEVMRAACALMRYYLDERLPLRDDHARPDELTDLTDLARSFLLGRDEPYFCPWLLSRGPARLKKMNIRTQNLVVEALIADETLVELAEPILMGRRKCRYEIKRD